VVHFHSSLFILHGDACYVTIVDATGTALRGSGVLTDITYLKQSHPTDGPDSVVDEELSTAAAWIFDDQVSQLTVPGGSILWLKKKEACFLRLLADAGATPLRRSAAVIGIYSRYDDAALHSFDMLVSRLRKKVESHTGGPFPLLTVHGLGYLFTAPLLRK
jgi:DNA-binding response OmpR family regulator